MTIERRGRAHRAVCSCGWMSHHWNELRPAEADAWHHVYGDESIVDVSAITDERSAGAGRAERSPAAPTVAQQAAASLAVEHLVRQAQDLAGQPSPYSRGAATELWRGADQDGVKIQAAVTEIEELLARHERQSSRAADSEWLELITAKRLLLQALAYGGEAGARRALI